MGRFIVVELMEGISLYHRRFWPVWVVLLIGAVQPLPVTGMVTAEGADPRINQPFIDPEFQNWVDIFERPGREIYDRRQDIMRALKLQPGMWVADVGAGTGLFTRLFAPQVLPEGRVFAVDISAEFIRNINRLTKQLGQTNVVGVVNSQTSLQLHPQSIDLAFVCDTYHHFEQPRAMLRSIYSSLKHGAKLVIIDYRRLPGDSSPWVLQHVRIDKKGVIDEVEQAGFRLVEEKNLLQAKYVVQCSKPYTAE